MTNADLLSQPIASLLKRLAIPSSLGLLFNTLYNIVDTYYAGLISTEALSALSSSAFLFFVIVGIGYGGSSGITTLVGNALGEKEHDKARLFASKGLGILLLLGCVMGIFGIVTASSMLSMLSVEETYRPLALQYIQIILVGTPFFFATFGLNAVLVATGDTKSYRNSLIFGFFANIALNPLFIYGAFGIPAMGIGGIAFATVLIQIINTVYLTCKVFKTGLMHLSFFIPDTKNSRIIIGQSLPSALNMLMISNTANIFSHTD
jgi:putative MATE family efflux protein